jgi:hypothetical protein
LKSNVSKSHHYGWLFALAGQGRPMGLFDRPAFVTWLIDCHIVQDQSRRL